MHEFEFPSLPLPAGGSSLREGVRAFLARERAAGSFVPGRLSWTSWNPAFSVACAAAGYVGMTIPTEYGGRGLTHLHKFIVAEEMLAAGAPVGAHWIADRQSSEQILRHGTNIARNTILPKIASGECYFAIGMSEPDAGSDLAAVRTRAQRTHGGWAITGSKIWTSNAHRAHYLLALVRTDSHVENRHAGLTQFVIDLNKPGVEVKPIINIAHRHEFNEVHFKNYYVSDEYVVGDVGNGWNMVTGELGYERSGPDRFMSSYQLLLSALALLKQNQELVDAFSLNLIGRLITHLVTLRHMSLTVAKMLARGDNPRLEVALVKDIGTTFERDVPEQVRLLSNIQPIMADENNYGAILGQIILDAPSFTLRGGTNEILKGIIAKGLQVK